MALPHLEVEELEHARDTFNTISPPSIVSRVAVMDC